MPMLKVHIRQGCNAKQKQALLSAITDTVVNVLDTPLRTVRVMLEELTENHSIVAGELDAPLSIIQVFMMDGRTEAQKTELIATLTEKTHETTETPVDSIRVLIFDMPKINVGIGGKSAKALGR